MDIQTEKAFQKQPHMFAGKCRKLSRSSRKGARFVKSCGLGFKTPKTAVEGNFIDKKCPFTGNVSIRGKILRGVCQSAGKMTNTITVRRDYLHFIKKYRRYEKRHKMVSAHCSPAFTPSPGDEVTLGQCRPLSKTVIFNVVDVAVKSGVKGGVKSAN
eukprot:TRINITY_DN1086_c0_g1_i4.p1 TRINITY_DN1086_c0_g1~~TRINITY_DN1086_c0_g1_i4.p1  ORF type:complete len:157 (-),score=50.12 TRINITY_DN1086_c0_g1_i4:254-724(-)